MTELIIPSESARTAEEQRASDRQASRLDRVPSSSDSANTQSSSPPDDSLRFELSFVLAPPPAVTVSSTVSPATIIRVRTFRGAEELFPPPLSSSSSAGSGESELDTAPYDTILALQLALASDDAQTPIAPSPLHGEIVRTPDVYLDPAQLDPDTDTARTHRQFGIFANYQVSELGSYTLLAVLLRRVGLSNVVDGEVSPAGPQLARLSARVEVIDSPSPDTIPDEQLQLLNHFTQQGALVPSP